MIIQSRPIRFAGRLDSAGRAEIKGDTFWISQEDNKTMHIRVVGDSMFYRSTEIDTIFTFSSGDVFRKFKRSYFVNHALSSNRWEVNRIRPIKGGLAIGYIFGD